jgi:hypothetical protein
LRTWAGTSGCRGRGDGDTATYADILNHTKSLVKRAIDEKALAPKLKASSEVEELASLLQGSGNKASVAKVVQALVSAAAPVSRSPSSRASTKAGHCIRCGDDIPLNPDRPLCGDCYKAWAKYENRDYKEAHCHVCGKERSTSFAKPLCRSCWAAQA